MSTSRNWSHASAPCRLEWRPSKLLAGVLLALGVLAALSVIASEMPRLAAWPLALAAAVYAFWMARRELIRPRRSLIVWLDDSRASLDGASLTGFGVHWRGPLALLHWRDPQGQRMHLHCWPDTLAAGHRRELRLAMIARPSAPGAPSMAP